MGGTNSKETPEQTAQQASNLQKKAVEKGGSPLQLGQGETFELTPNRGCTDMVFLLIWIVFWCGMLAIAVFALTKGEPERLHFGYDFNGNTCGVGGMKSRPFVYYVFPYPNNLDSGSLEGADFTWAACVKTCPTPRLVFAASIPIPPNSCMQSFKVTLEAEDATGTSNVVTCGDQVDGTTDMTQFGVKGFVKYVQYCLQYRPLCTCKKASVNATSSSCCIPDAVADSVGAQVFADNIPQVEKIDSKIKKQFGIPIGYQYGFCFVPYPSYAPGSPQPTPDKNETTIGAGSWTRCIPMLGSPQSNVSADYSKSLALIESSMGSNSTAADKDGKAKGMEKALAAVVASMSGPGETAKALVEQVRKYKWVIAGCAGIALIVSILYTFLLKIAAFPLILTIMVSVWVLLAGMCALLGLKAGYIQPNQLPGSSWAATQMPEGVTFGPAETNQQLVIAGCVMTGVCLVAYSFVLCIMVPRLKLACQIINVASVCLASMPTTLLFPIIQFFFSIAIFTYFIVVLWYLASAGSWDSNLHRYIWDENLQRLMIVHFFGMLWGQAFVLAVGNLAVAGAAAEWFLADDKKSMKFPAISSAGRTLRYHIGTAAFGSFIIAVVQLVRWVFRYYMYQLKKLNKEGTFRYFVAILSCIGECCLSCLERFLNFINKNAYIQTAITGKSFLPAASAGCLLLIRNCLRIGTLQIIATAFIFLGKYFVALVVAVIAAIWMVALDSGGSISDGWANVSSAPVFPVVIVLILAFNIACAFLDVWDMVIDTIFQCYCMDEEYGTGKTPGEMKSCVAENPPSSDDIQAIDAITTGAPGSTSTRNGS